MIRLLIITIKIFAVGLVLSGCAPHQQQIKKYRIGFSQCTGDDKWRKATLDGLKRELAFHPGTELLYRNAEDNSQLQIDQIRELGKQHIDILLVSPNEAEPLTPIIEETFNRGIPVVVIDRKIKTEMYTAFVGADNSAIGKMAAEYIINMEPGPRRIVQILGLQGSTPATDRQVAFEKSLSEAGLKVGMNLVGDWLKESATARLLAVADSLAPGDIIFAQNDPMALGAYDVYKQLGLASKATFIGVDALSGPGGGIDLVSKNVLKATLLNPTGAEEALQVGFKILEGQPFRKINILSSVVVDPSNVRIMQLQTDKIKGQQNDIEKQQELLQHQQQLYKDQQAVINIFIGALLLVLSLTGISIYALVKNRRITRRLTAQNEEISQQRNQLVEMTEKARQATEAKMNFFTNISHELRTPLTLIIGPLEDSLASPKLHFTIHNNLTLVYKNAMRLLRLINQLMDYRKIEEARMKPMVSEHDIVSVVTEIVEAFQGLARKKSISLTLLTRVKSLPVFFDANMIDKVLFNLLSNAFKFTADNGGQIRVIIDKDSVLNYAVVRVEDTGCGMTPEEVEHAFDLFYQGRSGHAKGTGLGLSLSRELVHLHKGEINLKSEKWKGCVFEIRLPLGQLHFDEENLADSQSKITSSYEDIKIYSTELEKTVLQPDYSLTTTEKQHSILIIEDNEDLRLFLKNHLGEYYDIYEAEDGNSGLNLAYEVVPDLILCDVILPGRDGLQITELLKQDIRTSHIPLIILTAKGSIQEQIQGIRLQADAFIVKPFNLEFLMETIKTLLKSRAVLRNHFTSELPSDAMTTSSRKIDRKFINEFTAIVESNVPNDAFSVQDICREIGISKVQLYRKVKALLDYNVNDYILSMRMQKAKYLLANDNISISDVAFKVGFSSQAYFATVFKSKFSITPTEYRESKKSPAKTLTRGPAS